MFSKWITVLQEWLEMVENEDYDAYEEIIQWFKGWKSFLPKQVVELPEIEEIMKIALLLIDQKV